MFDLITVGHFAFDQISSPRITKPRPTLGGSPTFVSIAARRLDRTASVISKVGEDFSDRYIEWLNAQGVDLSGVKRVKGASTTRFEIRYSNGNRTIRLRCRAPMILREDLPDSLGARIIHVAPIANEISPNVVEHLRSFTDTLSLDPQGFVRIFDAAGNMRFREWGDQPALGQFDIFKSSSSEIKMITGTSDLQLAMKKIHNSGVKIVLATMGIKGSKLLFKRRFYDIPACKPRNIRDPTGAGDAFIGAFLAEYMVGKDPVWSAYVGSASASFVLEGLGSEVFGEKREIYARAAEIYGQV